ncbi:tripartite tricarboxylate transporter TctB family protein [Ectopseudomonas toyotomiensis]|uniref:Tripartite tricarboxylate transporter TctB family protein n=1 Tax=Ectopseudomonas toyotomiensis TaxID=554344 RepID=A0AA42IRU2_9GAMM|nr:tripartite tricarboxylate transporter TctB family protein [Pseudomonas toyotomiensis]MBG0839991.1 tripartite tricarboxylate transporter TctB family protein [Pseudomonas toyotomiensis]MDH0704349.1 tripartite tricarboxylate transporter TctB family protein [Pseudomonas toyotomiensis]
MKDLLFGIIFIALGITVWLLAREFPVVPGMQYGADLFPSLIAIGMTIGGLLLSISALRQLRTSGPAPSTPRLPLPSFAVILPGVLVVAYIYLSDVLGAATMMLLIMLVLLVQRGVRVLPAIVIAAVATAVISLSFGHLLKVPLPVGPLGF